MKGINFRTAFSWNCVVARKIKVSAVTGFWCGEVSTMLPFQSSKQGHSHLKYVFPTLVSVVSFTQKCINELIMGK
jgi:hypothetical protein